MLFYEHIKTFFIAFSFQNNILITTIYFLQIFVCGEYQEYQVYGIIAVSFWMYTEPIYTIILHYINYFDNYI